MSSSATTPEEAPAEPAPAAPLRRPRLGFLVLGLVLAGALAVGLFTTVGSSTTGGRPAVGQPAPTFALPRLGGGPEVGIPADGGAAGHPAVVLFYASDCVPCQSEIPALAALYRHQQREGRPPAALVGVAAADPAPAAFARSSGVTFPVGLDTHLTVTNGAYAFTALPEEVFVTGAGTIADVHYGALSASALVAGERRYLGV